jgi:hypothetical protein
MAEGRSPIPRFLFLALCLGVTALGAVNTYGDNSAVVEAAKATACPDGSCSFHLLRQERSPLAQRFGFQLDQNVKGRAKSASADVECSREYILLGEYHCKLTSGGFPAPAGS